MENWVNVMLYSPQGDPRHAEAAVLMNHFAGTGLIPVEYRRVQNPKAMFAQVYGVYAFQVLTKEATGETGV